MRHGKVLLHSKHGKQEKTRSWNSYFTRLVRKGYTDHFIYGWMLFDQTFLNNKEYKNEELSDI